MPLTDHPVLVLPASIVQLTPVPAGRLSLTLSPAAAPLPALMSDTVKPIWDPALTLEASATLVILVVAHSTASEAEAESEPSLLVVKLAMLL